jgi:non-homologous end joining protein Ku
MVEFTSLDFENLPSGTEKTVLLRQLSGTPDPLRIENSYVITPEKSGQHALSILYATLKKLKKSVMGEITMRERERPCAIWMRGDKLILSTLRWPAEVRENIEVDYIPTSKDEIALATQILEGMDDPILTEDRYSAAIVAAAKVKSEGRALPVTAKKTAIPVSDLTEALRASVEAVRAKKAASKG